MPSGTCQAVSSSTTAPSSSWDAVVLDVQHFLAINDIMLQGQDLHTLFHRIVLLTERHSEGDAHTPSSIRDAQQLAAALPMLKLPQLLAKILAFDPVSSTNTSATSGSSSKWQDMEYTALVCMAVATSHNLYMHVMALAYPESNQTHGMPDAAQKSVAAATRDAVRRQLLPSGLLGQLAAAQEQLAALLQDPLQQQQMPEDQIMLMLGANANFAELLRAQSPNSAELMLDAAQLGPVAAAAARLCIAVLQHPERVRWQKASKSVFLDSTMEMLSEVVSLLHDASRSIYVTGIQALATASRQGWPLHSPPPSPCMNCCTSFVHFIVDGSSGGHHHGGVRIFFAEPLSLMQQGLLQ